MTPEDDRRQQLHLTQASQREPEEIPVEHTSAAFDRAVSGFDRTPAQTVVPVLARRRRLESAGGG